MRALVLSGGHGSRLRPLTHTSAKQLIPIAGEPILFHVLRSIAEADIRDVGVVVGRNGDEIRAAVGDGSKWDLAVSYIEQPEPRGLADAVLTAAAFVRGEPFLMYLGDNVILEGVTDFVREFERTRPDAQIFLARVPEPERFGVAVLEGERVVRLVEKPREHLSDLALAGIYLFDDQVLEACRSLTPSWRGEYEITEAIQWLIDHGRNVRARMVSGWWKDTGKPEDLLEANRMMLSLREGRIDGDVDAASRLEGIVAVGPGAKVSNSRLVGPVVIGAESLIEDSTVGPDVSIEPGCQISGSEISDSIVMQGCRVVAVHGLSGSILGREADVRHSGAPGLHRLVVGDHSRVEFD